MPHNAAGGALTAGEPESIELPSVAILGAGAIGASLLRGLTKPSVTVNGTMQATCYSTSRAADLSRFPQVHAACLQENPAANKNAVLHADLVVLAVSPDLIPAVTSDICDSLKPGALVVSVAAGVTLARLQTMLPVSATVIRALPNMGGEVGFGVTGVGRNECCTEEQLGTVSGLFRTIGTVVAVGDDKLDAVSSLSGTGPGYFYFFVEQLTATGVELGFSQEQARAFAEQTFLGSAALMHSSGRAPSELLGIFTAPDGTSIKAIEQLSNADLGKVLLKATSASISRAREIAAETGE
ncbi:pyrroline-5-carboxylate reductase dimerization domain-containing protein [Arthrobacter sp. NQ7]|uniref:pyrroline-5-carboxylate reductase family protein n=1 Tax=Arthrobacter sp. NQ7 TaxID=3032303 RepID=UPI00240F2734|nr:pyrroline-5-carboxylate reductase dimerization domain-containing protein [Arthrobacter sp. NQ7]MDJ0459143.1 pyrroline-5-carboxylate reductase dimerization domain-containing protein [Arthrobacter sp. NQ7]